MSRSLRSLANNNNNNSNNNNKYLYKTACTEVQLIPKSHKPACCYKLCLRTEQKLVTNECATTLFELYAHNCCFYLLKCSLHWRNPYQSMHSAGGGGGGGGGALPSPYPPLILTLPRLPSIPSLPPPKKFVRFLFLFSAQIQNSEKGHQENCL